MRALYLCLLRGRTEEEELAGHLRSRGALRPYTARSGLPRFTPHAVPLRAKARTVAGRATASPIGRSHRPVRSGSATAVLTTGGSAVLASVYKARFWS